MTEEHDLEPVDIEKIFLEFSDHSLAELMLTIKDLREQRDHEQKVNAAKEFKLQKAEEELETLRGRINTSTAILQGESDICIDCEAVKDKDEDKD